MFCLRSCVRPAAAALLGLVLAGSAGALTIATGSYSQSGLGAEFATPYDSFVVAGRAQTIAPFSGPLDIAIAGYSFEVGPNCFSCTLTPSFDALFDVTVDGQLLQLDLPFAWSSNGPNDSLSFASAAPLRFDLGAQGTLRFALDDMSVLSSSGGFVRGQLTATIDVTPVPEPTTTALLFGGLGFMTFIARRRSLAKR